MFKESAYLVGGVLIFLSYTIILSSCSNIKQDIDDVTFEYDNCEIYDKHMICSN